MQNLDKLGGGIDRAKRLVRYVANKALEQIVSHQDALDAIARAFAEDKPYGIRYTPWVRYCVLHLSGLIYKNDHFDVLRPPGTDPGASSVPNRWNVFAIGAPGNLAGGRPMGAIPNIDPPPPPEGASRIYSDTVRVPKTLALNYTPSASEYTPDSATEKTSGREIYQSTGPAYTPVLPSNDPSGTTLGYDRDTD